MEKNKIRQRLKLVGIIGFVIGFISFIISLLYMNEAIRFNTTGALSETIFFSLLGMTSFISGTIVYMKSLDFLPS
ncbi:MAG: hypothetical protein ACFFAU_06580 [Candidatus Hodarchaeota archaeon]